MTKKRILQNEPSLDSQERLIEIMNNSPRVKNFAGTEWEIRALRPGTQWLIAEQAVKICKAETSNYGDVVKQFALNLPATATVITLGLLNDKNRIFENGTTGVYSQEFQDTYNTVMWDTNQEEWISLLVEILSMLDIEVFFSITSSIQILRQRLLERKKTTEEQKLLSLEQSGGK